MYLVAALYHFTRFDDPENIRAPLLTECKHHGVMGSLLLAHEGINGTIAGSNEAINHVLAHIRALPNCAALEHKESRAATMPFARMKVRLKKEIVTMGQPNIDPTQAVGHYVAPKDWDDLCQRDDVVVIDTRNDYEYDLGTFEGSVNPKTKTFRDFPRWWQDNAENFAGKKVAMFCTGGIRCEKASNFLLQEGVEEVYHLKGGILKYLEEIPEQESYWQGGCFVFDQRVSVGHGLQQGEHTLCHGCRMPLLPEDYQRPEFEMGVSCHQCLHKTTPERRAGFRERQKQRIRENPLKEQS